MGIIKRTKRIPIESVLPCLNLSQEQMDKIKFILKESRTCEMECKLKLKTTMESLRKQQAEKLFEYKGLEKDSLVRQRIESIKKEYAKLAKETQLVFQINMKKCNETTLSLTNICTAKHLHYFSNLTIIQTASYATVTFMLICNKIKIFILFHKPT